MKLVCDDCGRVFEGPKPNVEAPLSEDEMLIGLSANAIFTAYHAHLDTHLLQASIEEAVEDLCEAMTEEPDPDDDDPEGKELPPLEERSAEPVKSRFSRVK